MHNTFKLNLAASPLPLQPTVLLSSVSPFFVAAKAALRIQKRCEEILIISLQVASLLRPPLIWVLLFESVKLKFLRENERLLDCGKLFIP